MEYWLPVAWFGVIGFGSWYLFKVLRRGPEAAPPRFGTAARPLAVVDDGGED